MWHFPSLAQERRAGVSPFWRRVQSRKPSKKDVQVLDSCWLAKTYARFFKWSGWRLFFFKSLEWLSDFLVCFWCWYFLSFYWKLKILSYCWFQQVFFGFFAALLVSKSHQYPASSVDRPFVACIQLESKGCHFTKHHALKWWHLLHLKTNRRCIKNMILGIKQVIFADDDWVSTSPKRKRIVFRFHETILSFGELLDP